MSRYGFRRFIASAVSGRRSRRGTCEALERRCLLALSPASLSGPMLWDEQALIGDVAPKAERPYVADQVVVALNADLAPTDFATKVAQMAWPQSVAEADLTGAQYLLTSTKDAERPVTLVTLPLTPGSDVPAVAATLEALPQVAWASPNFVYVGDDPREFTPNDPQYGSQYHHPLMQNNLAWDTTLGDPSVIIAVTDDGVSYTHTDLAPNIWANNDPINGVDDDGNGRIDDLRGWDFIDGDNNPTHDNGDNHGSHVAGIAAGRTNNGIGISGTAGGATIMPVRFYGSSEGWNAAEIAASFAYSVDNGAKIVSTSYNIDGWVGDPTFTAGLQYIYDQGGLHFNSAGNNGALNPPRQAFHQSLFVASTNNLDVRDSSSNYGTGIDLAAPGANILSTVPTNQYAVFSGTSMATPNAAGVAALIWSLHPTWTRDQVAAQITGTAVNIDAQNASIAGLLGHGRVNSFQALTQTIAPPTIDDVTELPPEGGTVTTPPTVLTVELASVFDPATVNNAANWELRGDGPDNQFDTADDTLIPITPQSSYMIGTNDLKFNVASLPADRYQFRAKTGLADPFGQALDGDSNGSPGQAYVRTFTFERQLPIGVGSPLGGLTYQGSVSETSATPGVPFTYETDFASGQVVSIVAAPNAGSPTLTLTLKQGATTLATATSPAPGQPAVLASVSIAAGGDYQVVVQSSTANGFTVTGYLQTGYEAESNGGASNNTIATAQSLEGTSVELTPTADRLAVIGRTETTNGDFYAFDLQAGQTLALALHRVGSGSIALQLQDAGGAVLANGAAGFTNVSLAVQEFTAPSTGTYYARVSGTANQNYTLVATRGASFGLETSATNYTQSVNTTRAALAHNGVPPIATESEPNDNGVVGGSLADLALANDLSGSFTLSAGQYVASVSGTITSGNDVDWDFFRFYAKPGDTLQLDLDGISLSDSFLHLFGNSAVELASDDDSGPGTDAQIIFSNFAYAGDYYIVADSYSSNTGTYSLTARLTTNSVTLGGDADRYSFNLAAGETITWTTTTPDFGFNSNLDPKIELYDPSSVLVASDDNGAPDGRNALLSYTAPSAGTYSLRVLGASGVGSYVISAAADTTSPSLDGVALGSTLSLHIDYAVPVGSGEQLRTAPVALINQIAISFDEPVDVEIGDLTVTGVNVPSYSVVGFNYNAATDVATWTLSQPIDDDRVTLTLDDSVTDASGNALDGEWENPTTLLDPSSSSTAGDGIPGGDFVFQFTSLPGDANRDNAVSGADFTIWADEFDNGVGLPIKRFIEGDFSGDGHVTGADYTIWADHYDVVLAITERNGFETGGLSSLDANESSSGAVLAPPRTSRAVSSRTTPAAARAAELQAPAPRRAKVLRAVDNAFAAIGAFATLGDFRVR